MQVIKLGNKREGVKRESQRGRTSHIRCHVEVAVVATGTGSPETESLPECLPEGKEV